MTKTKYLVLGTGAASSWAVRGIRQEDKEGDITIVGKEPYRTYSLPLLSKGFIQGRYPKDKIFTVKEDFYESNGVTFINDNVASCLNTENKTVKLENGDEILYEKLLICTGGSPLKFNIPGSDLRRIYYLRTLDDAKKIKAAAESAKEAVVIGGSFIGIELAAALRELGLSVKLLMMEKYPWQNLIPEEIGNYFSKLLEENGVSIYPEQKVVEFVGEKSLTSSVRTESGEVLEGDLFGVGIGIRLNTDFLQNSGLNIREGLLVNEYLETNIPDIYAAGDVAEFNDLILGITHLTGHIESAQFQGRTAGRNMAGTHEAFSQVTAYDTEIFGNMLMFVGGLQYGDEHIIRGDTDEPEGSFSFKDGKLVGASLIKPGGKDIRAVRELIELGESSLVYYKDVFSDSRGDLMSLLKELKNPDY
ncbi:MAG: pyridine nucleotide-disulfide oxidoreductase [Thermodesulfobacteriota bacterium]|nr:MAG: pyridine nucleotide-disulfide oxidoreductase [Thermodesulfobacteriota bacterium]